MENREIKPCPFCGENIPVDATVCEYCAEILEGNSINSNSENNNTNKNSEAK